MKRYVSLPWEKTDAAASKLYSYVKTRTNILSIKQAVNIIEINEVIDYVPELSEFFTHHGVTPSFGFFLCSHPGETLMPHVDYGRPKRFLFPVLNCQGSFTEFYKAQDSEIVEATLKNGKKFYNVKISPPYDILDRFELVDPVVIDTGIPHGVSRHSTNTRLSFTVATAESLDHFLQ